MKTVRGTHYVVQIGNRFYKGEVPETIEGKEKLVDKPALKKLLKEKGIPKYMQEEPKMSRYTMRAYRFSNQHGLPDVGYKVKNKRINDWGLPSKTVEFEVKTGRYLPEYTDAQDAAKKFRLKSKAVAKANELAKAYEGFNPKVVFVDERKGDR